MASAHRGNLTSRIVNALGAAIVKGVYSPDNPFPVESALCVQYSASRSVLREAVKMLTAKGLLRARPRQGTWVQDEKNWNLLDPDVLRWMLEREYSGRLLVEFTEVRLAFEPTAARLAALNATSADNAAIATAIRRMYAAVDRGQDSLISDIEFHSAVLTASHNRFYASMREMVETALRFSIRRTNDVYTGIRSEIVAEHEVVAFAIAARQPDEAETAMRALIVDALELIVSTDPAAGRVISDATAELISRAAGGGR